MLDVVWLNLVELSKQKTFREILSTVTSTEKEWKKWFDSDAPEEEDIPCGYQVHFYLMRIPGTLPSNADNRYNFIPYHDSMWSIFHYQAALDVFRKLLLIRSCCPDRTLAQVS